MIKVFKTTNEYDNYVEGGMVAGDLYYVIEDKSVHFRTNNINGEDNEYDMSEGGGSSELVYTEIESNENGEALIPCSKGDVIEIIGSNKNSSYIPAAFFDANKEFLDNYSNWFDVNDYTKYCYCNLANAAYIAYIDTAGNTNFTAKYRKIN